MSVSVRGESRTPEVSDANIANNAFFRSYVDYNRLLIRSAVSLNTLLHQAQFLETEDDAVRVANALSHIENGAFSIAVIGEFKRGKSTLVNALLGSSTLPMDVMPVTASITRIVYDRTPHATLVMRDGTRQEIPLTELSQHITKIDAEAEARASAVREAIIGYPTLFCQNNVEIIDTPGLSDEAAMTRLTLDIIPRVDAAVFVISALAPFSQTEADFLKLLLESVDVGRVFFAVTHVDQLHGSDDVQRLTEGVRQRIHKAVKAIAPHAADQSQIRLFPLSAFQALSAKECRDSGLFSESRFGDLENALGGFLAGDRGAASLSQVMQVVREVASQQEQALEQRIAGLKKLDAEEITQYEGRLSELDGILAASEVHLSDQTNRVEKVAGEISKIIERGRNELLTRVDKSIASLSLSDRYLEDREAREAMVKRELANVVNPRVDELCKKTRETLLAWVHQEDDAFARISGRLDAALADRGTTREKVKVVPRQETCRANIALELIEPELPALSDLADAFNTAFRPSAGVVAEAQGVASKALANDTLQEGWRTVRGWLESDGRWRAEAQIKQTRDQIRERLRRGYAEKTADHIDDLIGTVGFEPKALEAIGNVAGALSGALTRENEHILKLVEWRRVELKIDNTRQNASHLHDLEQLEKMKLEAQQLAVEAERHSQVLAAALRKEDDTSGIGGSNVAVKRARRK